MKKSKPKTKICLDCGVSLNLEEEKIDKLCSQCQAIRDENNPDIIII